MRARTHTPALSAWLQTVLHTAQRTRDIDPITLKYRNARLAFDEQSTLQCRMRLAKHFRSRLGI